MALRLRRGTDLERIGVVFAEGELVYSTDTKRLFIGDGVTAGGVPVSDIISDQSPQLGASLDLNTYDIVGFGNINVNGDITASGTLTVPNIITDVQGSIFGDDSSPLVDGANNKIILDNNSITDLSDVDTTGVQVGDVLKWDGANWLASDEAQVAVSELLDVDLNGLSLGDILSWNGFNWVPDGGFGDFFEGDVRGSIFGEDSTLIVDSILNSIYASSIATDTINAVSGRLNVNGLPTGGFSTKIQANQDRFFLELNRTDDAAIKGTSNYCGAIKFSQTDINETFAVGYIASKTDYLAFGHHTTSTENDIDIDGWMILKNGRLTLGYGLTPGTERLHVTGNAVVTGFVQVGRYTDGTARDTAITAPDEGMIVFNQATQKFQGYVADTGLAGGGASNSTPGWVDLY